MNLWVYGEDPSLVATPLMTNILFLQFSFTLEFVSYRCNQRKKGSCDEDLGLLDPDRIRGKHYELVHRSDTKLCPKSVQRCEQYRIAFHQGDIALVKTVDVRERTDKTGKTVKYTGNDYLHYLSTCLKEYDQNFTFAEITVSASTLSFLPDGSRELLTEKGLHVQQ